MVCWSGKDGIDQEMVYILRPVDMIFKMFGATNYTKKTNMAYIIPYSLKFDSNYTIILVQSFNA
jgi:hypothetical protein